ncbi:N-acetylmuramoyl-L-alanine amidase [Candidatus Nomurabacteria bacterium]|nr:N-acetylmuramoyl-L-alanine amidase [Candidatus Nomurabacteria bacterium]
MFLKKSPILFLFISVVLFLPIFSAKASVAKPVKILIVPGHDNEVWGAQYGNIKEANMTLALATRIFNSLKKDKRFEVHITRDKNGYTKEFADYFINHKEDIVSFKENAKQKTKTEIAIGNFIQKIGVPHNKVTSNTAIKLYGINKWANENQIDAVLHIHFNDYPRKTKWTIGKYTGFAVYMPEGQMANWKESGQLAADIYLQLEKKYSTSNFSAEKGGLVPDQSLIALGANNSLLPSVRSVLVEYGYIYEKKFRNYETRHRAYDDMASLTVKGIKNYFLLTP